MKQLFFLFILVNLVNFSKAQNILDKINPLFKGDLDGELIRKTMSNASNLYYAGTSYMQPKGSVDPPIIIEAFYSHKLSITKQMPREALQELRDFERDTIFLNERNPYHLHLFPAIAVLDSSGIIVTASGIDKTNAGNYEFRILENKTKQIVPWHNISLFCQPYTQSFKPDGSEETVAAYLGEFKTTFGKSLTVDIRRKGNATILSSLSAIWINRAPSVLGVFTNNEMRSFLSVFKNQWQADVLSLITAQERKTKDSLLTIRHVFESGENNLIFYLDDKVQSKEIIEYNLIDGNDSTGWRPNDFDFNFIWLQNLSPGKYTLRIRYSVQRHNVAKYVFTIKPAWYQTILFKIITAVLFAAFIGFVLLLLKTRKQKQRLILEQLENQKNQVSLKSVRSQLNPHFVFNALSSIQGLINKNDIDGANQYLSEFSTLMRDTLNESDNDFISLFAEIKILDSYLKLEQLRFGFNVEIETDELINTNEVDVPALLLQPLAENAVKHGISSLSEKGNIRVSFKKSGNDMIVSIVDNGKGFKQENASTGYGLKLTTERIKLLNSILKEQSIQLNISNNSTGVNAQIIFTNWLA